MTFSTTVPNSTQSPGLFPAQNNTNFLRIKDIVNIDHNWTDSSSLSQGIHKQATFINRNAPGALPAGNGILYSTPDASGASQLNWYTSAGNVQITPGVQVYTGNPILAPLASSTMFADPGYAYQAYYWLGAVGFFSLSAGITVHFINDVNQIIATQAPFIEVTYSGNDLIVTNTANTGSPIPVVWTLEVIRLP